MKAGMRFTNDRLRDCFIDIEEILFNRSDDDHIKPKDKSDYDPKHLYSVYCCYCKTDECTGGKLCKFYKGYIFGLGETDEEIIKNHKKSCVRIAFKNIKDISDSDDSDHASQSQKERKAAKSDTKSLEKDIWENNKRRVSDKYKLKNIITCREHLIPKVVSEEKSNEIKVLNTLETVASQTLTKEMIENEENLPSNDEVLNLSLSMISKKRCLLTEYGHSEREGQTCKTNTKYVKQHINDKNKNDAINALTQ